MQEIQTMCVPQEIKKVRNFWEANLSPSAGPTRSKSTDSACVKKKNPPQVYPKPPMKKVVKQNNMCIIYTYK